MNIIKFFNNKKKKIQRSLLAVGSIFVFFLVPLSVFAVTDDPLTDPNFQLAPTTCGVMVNGVPGRECGWADFLNLINRIMKFIIVISASIGVLMFAYAGFLYLTAFGEMGKVEQAHKIFSTTITGIIIIMLAWLIVATILKVLGVGPLFTVLKGVSNVQTITTTK
ncbi:MAG: hypothetical protein V4509_03810 [Patescibacteria group bacterium]